MISCLLSTSLQQIITTNDKHQKKRNGHEPLTEVDPFTELAGALFPAFVLLLDVVPPALVLLVSVFMEVVITPWE